MPASSATASAPPPAPGRAPDPARQAGIWFGALALTTAALLAYAPSFAGGFVFDDEPAILFNRTLEHVGTAWFPPADTSVSGRPIANLSFALNHALGGLHPVGYHVLNFLIHLGVGLTLFGLVRRTFARLRYEASTALWLGVTAALVWTLHPLETEAVTYLVQRVESLMALWFVLTLYGFVRSVDSARPLGWRALSVTACVLGMGTKEVMAVAPIVVLLYDRTFVAGTFRRAWAERRGLHLALAATWVPLLALVASTGWNRGGTAGFDVGVSPLAYWATQLPAVAHYLRLTVWPRPLVFDYATYWVHDVSELVLPGLVVTAFVAGTAWALFRRPVAGFIGATVLLILAPTSVVPGTLQMMAEQRMYLPSAVLVAAAVALGFRFAGRWALGAFLLVAVLFAGLTARRNLDYRSPERLWADTVAKQPTNDRAHNNLGNLLAREGRWTDAVRELKEAVRLNPSIADAHHNLGNALRHAGRLDEAVAEYEAALRLNPRMPDALTALGTTFEALGRDDEALARLEQAVHVDPGYVAAQTQLGLARARIGDIAAALPHFEAAARLTPDDADVHNDLGNALSATGRIADAEAQYREALRLRPNSVEAHHNLGNLLRQTERLPEAISEYQQALAFDPHHAATRTDLGVALLLAGRTHDAIAHFEEALRTAPDYGPAHLDLALALESVGRSAEAQPHLDAARRLGVPIPSALAP